MGSRGACSGDKIFGKNAYQEPCDASPEGFWYDQDENKRVLLLDGEAGIECADGTQVHLTRGDTLNLPAHTRHRVTFTSRSAIWLAVFY
jgi:cupin 2 domain-containing protein